VRPGIQPSQISSACSAPRRQDLDTVFGLLHSQFIGRGIVTYYVTRTGGTVTGITS
jgi:hypothetical protein